ncbi:hypothetical protein [Bowdeniella massiliensis]|uniref:hypothetical protein n=1 Tax=Bowdeniella massiliensis TaxID=2932264 RepID=UPI002028D5A0|nr:hypothetical protein [Bowdeniella massiliensis]
MKSLHSGHGEQDSGVHDHGIQQSRGPAQQLDISLTSEESNLNVGMRARGTERDFEAVTPVSGFNQEIRATTSHLVRIQYPIGFGVTNDDAFHGSELEIYGDRA